jgi:hypothetical protein
MYWIESIHGVIVDVTNNLAHAKKLQAEVSGFQQIPRRVFTFGAKGKRIYL